MHHATALVTLAAIALYFWMGLAVGRARIRLGVRAPATTGHPEFERLSRVHINTLEWMPIFLPSLWLFSYFTDERVGAMFGVVWIVGRFLYMRGYGEAPEKRGQGFALQAIATGVLFVGAVGGVIANMI
jgi:glutathione S-transferase